MALAAALGLKEAARDALVKAARAQGDEPAYDELSGFPLPVALTTLLGRDADLQTLRQWLDDPHARLITIVGPGGVGKTRLALEIAHAVADERAARVGFVQLAAIRDPAFVASAIVEALGLSEATAADLPQRVCAACNDQHPMLLVLDNCEHVLDAAPLVVDLLTSAPSLRLLATSRAPLRVRGERLYTAWPARPARTRRDAVACRRRAGSGCAPLRGARSRAYSPSSGLRPPTLTRSSQSAGGSTPFRSAWSWRRLGSRC